MTHSHEPFEIENLPSGRWTVTWPGYEDHVVNNQIKVKNLLTILFEEVKVNQAQLGVTLNNGELETYCIDMSVWWRAGNVRDDVSRHIASTFVVGGATFDLESEARMFLEILEKRLSWARLGGKWK